MQSALRAASVASTSSEHELVAAVRAGEDRAFGELYARYRGRISGYIYGMVGDHARAEDIAQDVFISALRRLRATNRPIAFKAWIYEIAKNACIDEFRRTRRAREVPLESDGDGQDANATLISQTPTPESAVAGKQALTDLRGAFHGLSENHHKVLVMRELEGLSYSQIGDRMGMSKPVVESTLFRARRRLSEEYNELVSGRRCERVQTLISTNEPQSLLKLGIRERGQLARHLSHCQPCRRSARLAGVDESLFHAPSMAERIAALLPLPWLRWPRGGSGSHRIATSAPLQALARYSDMIAPSGSFGRVVAAIAALAVAGAGGGAVSAVAQHDRGPSTAGNVPPGLTRMVAPPTRTQHKHHATARAAPATRSSAGKRQAHNGHAKPAASNAAATGGSSSSPAGAAGSASGSSANVSGGGGSSGGSSGSPTHQSLVEVGSSQGGGGSISVSVPRLPKVTVSVPKVQTPSPPSGGTGGGIKVPNPTVPVPKVQVKLP